MPSTGRQVLHTAQDHLAHSSTHPTTPLVPPSPGPTLPSTRDTPPRSLPSVAAPPIDAPCPAGCLPQSGTYTPTVGCRASQQLTRGACWGFGLQWVESVGSEPHLRNTRTPCGVGQVCSTRCPCPARHASVSLRPASTSLETRWGVQALPQAVIGGGGDEPGALQGHMPMGAEAHDIRDPSALVFGAGHE